MVFNWFKRLFCVFLGFGVTTHIIHFLHMLDFFSFLYVFAISIRVLRVPYGFK